MSADPCPSLSSFAFLPDRDWNREWEAACSLTGSGRGGRDPRVTIALGQQFRAFAGAVAAAMIRTKLRPRMGWEGLAPVKEMSAAGGGSGSGSGRGGGGGGAGGGRRGGSGV